MPKLASLIYILFALAGCDLTGHAVTVHVSENGHDQLYSTVHITEALTVFHCIASTSGACHYTLFAHACPARGACDMKPFHTFAVPAGERLFDTTLPNGFVPCVSRDAHVDADASPGCPGQPADHRA